MLLRAPLSINKPIMNFSKILLHRVTIALICLMLSACILTPNNNYSLKVGDKVSIESSYSQSKRGLFNSVSNSLFNQYRATQSPYSTVTVKPDATVDVTSDNNKDFEQAPRKTGLASPLLSGSQAELVVIGAVVVTALALASVREVVAVTEYAVAKAQGVDTDKKDILYFEMAEHLKTHSTQSDFNDVFSISASQQFEVKSSPLGKSLSVHIEKLEFDMLGNGLVVLKVKAVSALYYTNKTGRKTKIHSKNYRYNSSAQSVDEWIKGQNDFYQHRLNIAYQSLTNQILNEYIK